MRVTTATKRGFTLIELLVVMAIISILASMMFPSFARIRESARRTSCANNMKQLGLGFTQYMQDYDGRLPGSGQYQKWGVGNGHWVAGPNGSDLADQATYVPTGVQADVEHGALYSYIKSQQIFVCPSNEDGRGKLLTYSMNCAVAGSMDSSVEGTTSVALLIDEEKCNDGMFYLGSGSTDHATQTHNGTYNMLFLDGHVKAIVYGAFPLSNSVQGTAAENTASLAVKQNPTGFPRLMDSGLGAGGYTVSAFGSCTAP